MKKVSILIIGILILSGCIYEFTPEIDSKDAFGLVVEGDILIGDTTRVTLSGIEPLSGATSSNVPLGRVWVEDDSGREYHPYDMMSSNTFKIDMTNASPDREYRLRIMLSSPGAGSSSSYSSAWKPVQVAPAIDDLSYLYDPEDEDIHLQLSLSSNEGSGCFRWDYDEIWEFHADSLALYYYDPSTDRVRSYDGRIPPLYYCWSYASSTQVGLAIAKSTGGERIVDFNFLDVNRRDYRMQTLYHITLKARGISEECYEYLHSIEMNSTSTGSLTHPDPSQIIGNIRSDSDPMEVVTGYIEVSQVATESMYIGPHFIAPAPPQGDVPPPVEGLGLMTMIEAYQSGLRPNDSPSHWVNYRCVECTAMGGTKIKPDFWPTTSE